MTTSKRPDFTSLSLIFKVLVGFFYDVRNTEAARNFERNIKVLFLFHLGYLV